MSASLKDRQKAWRAEEEERIVNRPDPDMPPGHRRMPDNERRETLALLLNSKCFRADYGPCPVSGTSVL